MSFYGYCPICGAKDRTRERRINGNDICEAGHTYPSRSAVKIPTSTPSNVSGIAVPEVFTYPPCKVCAGFGVSNESVNGICIRGHRQ